jgi:hypothetical protein
MAEDTYNRSRLSRRITASPKSAVICYEKVIIDECRSMKDEVMAAISKNDPSKINSAFIISIFCEDYFKEMMDEYLGKILVCGKAPKN